MSYGELVDGFEEVIEFTEEPDVICLDGLGDTVREELWIAVDRNVDSLNDFYREWMTHDEFPPMYRLAHYLWYVGQGHGVGPRDDIKDTELCAAIEELAKIFNTRSWETWTRTVLELDVG